MIVDFTFLSSSVKLTRFLLYRSFECRQLNEKWTLLVSVCRTVDSDLTEELNGWLATLREIWSPSQVVYIVCQWTKVKQSNLTIELENKSKRSSTSWRKSTWCRFIYTYCTVYIYTVDILCDGTCSVTRPISSSRSSSPYLLCIECAHTSSRCLW